MISGRHFELAQIPETGGWLGIQCQYMASDLISYASLMKSQYSVHLSLVDLPGWYAHGCSRGVTRHEEREQGLCILSQSTPYVYLCQTPAIITLSCVLQIILAKYQI